MSVPAKSHTHSRESERRAEANRSIPINNFRILKVRYGNRVETCKYCAHATSSNDLDKWIKETFGIANNKTFRLRGEDDIVFILAPIDFENNEIFRLEIDSEIDQDLMASTPPSRPAHDWKYYGKILLSKIRRLDWK